MARSRGCAEIRAGARGSRRGASEANLTPGAPPLFPVHWQWILRAQVASGREGQLVMMERDSNARRDCWRGLAGVQQAVVPPSRGVEAVMTELAAIAHAVGREF